MARHNRSDLCWTIPEDGSVSIEQAQLAVLMDIRDELQTLNNKLSCYRIPRALDAMYELGVEARRRERAARAKRKKAKASR